jgi:enoyl-CoA hydratase
VAESVPDLVRVGEGVAQITLLRARHANRIQTEDLVALNDHLSALEADPSMAALLITADGDHFSAGFDLGALRAQAAAQQSTGAAEDVAFEVFSNRLAQTRLATIAAMPGLAIGGATDLVLACDLRIGTPTAGLRMPAARFGLPLYAGALERYVIHFGLARAKSLVLTGRTITADELLATGVLAEIVQAPELRARALELAGRIAAAPALPLAAMKAAMNRFAAAAVDRTAVRSALAEVFDGPAIVARIDAARGAAKAAT